MKLTASVIARNEADRYLRPCLEHLLDFCDEIRFLDDSSTDGTEQLLAALADPRIVVLHHAAEARNAHDDFHLHAAARNRLLEFTLDGDPTHVLAIDADEFVTDGRLLRSVCELGTDVVATDIVEVWEACEETLCTREDGGWRSHPIGNVWRVEPFRRQLLTLIDRGHATGRVPEATYRAKGVPSGAATLHFGWTNTADRVERFARYDVGDGGQFHARTHIDSIMWPDEQVTLQPFPWPPALERWRPEILARATR